MHDTILGQSVKFDLLHGLCIGVEQYSDHRSTISGGNGLIIEGTGAIAPINGEAWTSHSRRATFKTDDGYRVVLEFPVEFDIEVNDVVSLVLVSVPSGEQHIVSLANQATSRRFDFGFDFKSVSIKKRLKPEVIKHSWVAVIGFVLVVVFLGLGFSASSRPNSTGLLTAVHFGVIALVVAAFVRSAAIDRLKKSIQSDAKDDFTGSVRSTAINLIGV